jgi:hypothetical protein
VNSPRLTRPGRLTLCASVALFLISGFAATAAHAGTVPTSVRVVSGGGKVLADVRQYTETTTVPTSPAAKCFFGGVGGSGKAVTLNGPTALGAVADAARSVPELNPMLITDEFSFGLGVCGFGGVQPSPTEFWQVRVDHKATQKGGDQVQVSKGDDVLWALIPAPNCPPPNFICEPTQPELALTAPARAKPGAAFGVTVLAYNDEGFLGPASGATVTGAALPTDAAGKTQVVLPASGTITASKSGAVVSRTLPVCVKSDIKKCPSKRGIPIFGSDLPDSIGGTAGNDTIKARGGNDKISVRGRGRDRVNCGPGADKVKADNADQIAGNCEKVERPSKGGQ